MLRSMVACAVVVGLLVSGRAALEAARGHRQQAPAGGGSATRVTSSLMYRDRLSWCGRRLVVTAGGSRVATAGEHLVTSSASRWRTVPLAPAGRLTSGAHASRRLTAPPPGHSDELPNWWRPR